MNVVDQQWRGMGRNRLSYRWVWLAMLIAGAVLGEIGKAHAKWLVAGQQNPAANMTRPKEAARGALTPRASLASLTLPQDLAIDLVLAEPQIAQPSFLRFDARGRLWVVEYRQYPRPAGVEPLSRDDFWRTRYRELPPPPGQPGATQGSDRISIHADTNGDGEFDQHTVFLDGLNLCTGLAWDRDGVWVLQPPYLLYYPDTNHDDVPDGPPEVHLSGFGIEDTHSIANSLTWGPDGWLYGAQGSTVSAAIKVTGRDEPPIRSLGQLMWRYHPRQRLYEIFSEGGGNIWSCQFDGSGRLFAGTNEGEKVGYHYLQGAYSQKNFGKHGDLSNDHAYGYFRGIRQPGFRRLSTNLLIYEDQGLPPRYQGQILAANPLAGQVLASRRQATGSTFRAQPLDVPIEASDRWFRPVYLEAGPDGCVYIADWYDQQISHTENHQGRVSPEDGRVYRLRSKEGWQPTTVDLGALSSSALIELLDHPSRWYRSTARRLLCQRNDREIIPPLRAHLRESSGHLPLQALWVLHQKAQLTTEERLLALGHPSPDVRLWAVRLIGDAGTASDEALTRLVEMSQMETDVEVRAQLACSAKRLPLAMRGRLLPGMINHQADASDPCLPWLVWWALESAIGEDPDVALEILKQGVDPRSPMMAHQLPLIARRLASGNRRQQRTLVQVFDLVQSEQQSALAAGVATAYRGRSMRSMLPELSARLRNAGIVSPAMSLRLDGRKRLDRAVQALANPELPLPQRLDLLDAAGELAAPELEDDILRQLKDPRLEVQLAALAALRGYRRPELALFVLVAIEELDRQAQTAGHLLLLGREEWAVTWAEMVKVEMYPWTELAAEVRATALAQPKLVEQLGLEPVEGKGQKADLRERTLDEIKQLLAENAARDPYRGRLLFLKHCASCHKLYREGGAIGPDLTGYQRADGQSLIRAIVDPSAEIREGFETQTVVTFDGQLLEGFVTDRDEQVIVLQPAGGSPAVLPHLDIEQMKRVKRSLMPKGLLDSLTDDQIRDLFAFLQTSQPLVIR